MAGKGLIPIPVAAKLLNLSPARTYALAAASELEVLRSGGAVWVRKASVESYKKRQEVPSEWIALLDAMERTGYSRTFFSTHPDVERRRHRGRVLLRLADVERVTAPRGGFAGEPPVVAEPGA